MPVWGPDSKEDAERLESLFSQLFTDPDPEVRRQAAETLLKEKGEAIRVKGMEVLEKEGFFTGAQLSADLQEQAKRVMEQLRFRQRPEEHAGE